MYYTEKNIFHRLCNRVIDVGMNSQNVKKDPELKKTLLDIKNAVDAERDDKKTSDWRDVTAEVSNLKSKLNKFISFLFTIR